MQDLFQNDYRTRYIIEKILDYLPGNSTEILEELSALLQNPEASVSVKRANKLKRIRDFLKDSELTPITRLAIENKIYALKNPPVSTSKMYNFGQFSNTLVVHLFNFLKHTVCKKRQPA